MAIKQSAWAKGSKQAARPQTFGAVHTQLYTYDVAATADALATSDILEIGELPPFAKVVDAIVFTEGTFTDITANIGLISGTYGDALGSRTAGSELYAAVDLTTFARLDKGESILIPPVDVARGIGVVVSGAVPAATNKKIHVLLSYTQ